MALRVELVPPADEQLHGLPEAAKKELVETLLVLMEEPRHPGLVAPSDDPRRLRAPFGDFGIVEFQPWEEIGALIVHRVIWAD